MQPVLLFRKSVASQYELRHAEKYFPIEESRMQCTGRLVIGRYAVTPFYDELERDLAIVGARLVNSLSEHRWIASFDYYHELASYTPETWDEANFYACRHNGPFVVKGKLSSRKKKWNTHMFAKTRRDALALGERLKEDIEIAEQGIVYRRYIPLKTYETGPNGLPYTNEWRFFYLKERCLSHGYYWAMADCAGRANLPANALDLADRVATIASKHATFFTLDLAETEAGDWILIELTDGQMAVPAENDLDELYGNLRVALGEASL